MDDNAGQRASAAGKARDASRPHGLWRTLLLVAGMAFALELIVMRIMPVLDGVVDPILLDFLDALTVGLVITPVAVGIVLVRHPRAGANLERFVVGWRSITLATTVLLTGLTLTGVVAYLAEKEAQHSDRDRFGRLSERVRAEVTRRMGVYRHGLMGTRGLWPASKSVERAEFDAMIASRDIVHEFPGTVGVSFIRRVPRERLEEFLAATRADGAPDFRISTSGDYPDLLVIEFLHTSDGTSEALGFDIGSDPVRRAAAERAMRTGEATLSAPIRVRGWGDEGPGFAYLLPIYKKGLPTGTLQERQAALEGWVGMGIVAARAFAGATDESGGELGLAIFSGECEKSGERVFAAGLEDPDAARVVHADTRGLAECSHLELGGRSWTLVTLATPKFAAASRSAVWAVGLGGALLAFAGAALAWSMGRTNARARAMAETMTAALRESERTTRLLAENTRDLVGLSSADGASLYLSPSVCRTLGYSPEELIETNWRTRVHPDDLPGVEAANAANLRGDPTTIRYRAIRKDGSHLWLECTATPVRSSDGAVENVVWSSRDVTAQQEAQEALERNERRMRTVIDTALDAVVAIDAFGNVTDWNAQAERTFGWTRGEVIGRPLHELIVPETMRESHRLGLGRYVQTGESRLLGRRIETSAVRKDGGLITIELAITAVRSGPEVSFSAFLRDITEKIAAEKALVEAKQQAEAASRAKTEFLANMSHEIRTPMTAILGFTDLLAEDGDLDRAPERRRDTIATIKRSGEHLLAIINDILDVSKIEAGKLGVERVPTDPAQVVEDVISLMQVRAQGKGVRLERIYENAIPRAFPCDPVRLKQILMNLVGNAVKFTEAGAVTVGVRFDETGASGARLVFQVRDTGIGMTSDQLSRLFSAFGQADSTTTRRFGGTGLGLTIAKRLSEMLGGSVTATSEVGKGSVFTATVATGPVAPRDCWVPQVRAIEVEAPPPPSPTARAPQNSPLAGVRILLAEDGPDNQRLILLHLKRAGADVTIVDDGRLAVQAMTIRGDIESPARSPSPFDLVLMDMQMPEMDGYTATRILRKLACRVPIIALTAHAMSGDREKCIDAGCDDYATKPIDKAALIATCEKWAKGQARSAAA